MAGVLLRCGDNARTMLGKILEKLRSAHPTCHNMIHSTPGTESMTSPNTPTPAEPAGLRLVPKNTISEVLLDSAARVSLGMPADDTTGLPVVVELNIKYREGVTRARERLLDE